MQCVVLFHSDTGEIGRVVESACLPVCRSVCRRVYVCLRTAARATAPHIDVCLHWEHWSFIWRGGTDVSVWGVQTVTKLGLPTVPYFGLIVPCAGLGLPGTPNATLVHLGQR